MEVIVVGACLQDGMPKRRVVGCHSACGAGTQLAGGHGMLQFYRTSST
jgi:hypothetical protein